MARRSDKHVPRPLCTCMHEGTRSGQLFLKVQEEERETMAGRWCMFNLSDTIDAVKERSRITVR